MDNVETCTIDGLGPLQVVQPHSVAEVGAMVRQAASERQAVYPVGGRTMLELGLPPARPGIVLSTTALAEVIDYPARDMTITVQAGTTIKRLQAVLATENQRLPVEIPIAGRATLGGAVATNPSGPRRLALGTLRDYVIGISVVNDEGEETKAGGRVVKNVAGYDLGKLHVGALGTLGVVTQLTLKLRPRPETTVAVEFPCPVGKLAGFLDRLNASRTQPSAITVVSPAIATSVGGLANGSSSVHSRGWTLFVGFEGNGDTVEWQVKQLQQELAVATTSRMGASAEQLWTGLTDFPLTSPEQPTLKANILPSAVAAFCEELAFHDDGLRLVTHAGNGIVLFQPGVEPTLETARSLVRLATDLAAVRGGNIVLLRCHSAWKQDLHVWGRSRSDGWLMKAVKDKLDPSGLFNPGRFVDGM